MFKTIKVKLYTNSEQHDKLLRTMKRFNQACNEISHIAFNNKAFGKVSIQKLCYYHIRDKYNLSAQLTVRAIGKVAESYRNKDTRKVLHTFKETGAVVYDQRILSFKGLDKVSILTLDGRILVQLIVCDYYKNAVHGVRVAGQADLILQDNIFYLLVVVDVPDDPEYKPKSYIGIDLGIKNIATDSTGANYSGNRVNALRKRHRKLRQKLQSIGTKSAKRLLKKRSRKEQRFARDVNHCISKELVGKVKGTQSGIALENLKGIRNRTEKTVRKSQRAQHSSWSFYQLRSFIEYKAKNAGVPVVLVDPRNTSRTCPECGHVSKKNRVSRDSFCCQACGYAGPADNIAARNIASRAAVNQPNVGVA